MKLSPEDRTCPQNLHGGWPGTDVTNVCPQLKRKNIKQRVKDLGFYEDFIALGIDTDKSESPLIVAASSFLDPRPAALDLRLIHSLLQ